MPVRGVYSPTEMLGVGSASTVFLPLRRALHTALPDPELTRQLPSAGDPPTTGRVEGEYPSAPCKCTLGCLRATPPLLGPTSQPIDPLTPTTGGWEGTYLPLGGRELSLPGGVEAAIQGVVSADPQGR